MSDHGDPARSPALPPPDPGLDGAPDVGNGDPELGNPALGEGESGDGHALITEPAPWWGPVALVVLIGLVVCTNIANGVWAGWIDDRPEQLLLLSSRQRYLVLAVTAGIGAVPYAVIGFVRLGVAFLACHFAGRAYRDHVLRIFTRYLGLTPEMVHQYEKLLDKAGWVIVPLFPGSNIVAALTGVRRMPLRRLVVLLVIGLVGRLGLMWWLAKVFEEPLLDVLKFIQRWNLPIIIGSIALVVLVNLRNFRRGAG